MNPHKILGALGAVAIAATLIACGLGDAQTDTSPGSTTAAKATEVAATTVKVGAPLTLSSALLGEGTEVTVTVSQPKSYDKEPGDYGMKPQRGKFLTVTVAVSVTKGTYMANPFDFRVVGPDGTVYENSFTTIGTGLHSTSLASGQKTTGTVTFDVPASALKGKVQINGIGLDSDRPAGYWTL